MTLSADTHRDPRIRTYDRQKSVVFLKTNEEFGGLSNMAGGFPLVINRVSIRSSEALYQACRFPHMPDVQKLIIAQGSPMTAKMKSKPYRQASRPDWDRVRVKIMRWCLRVKLAQNWNKFSQLLLATGDRPIVEESRKDSFWGAYPVDRQTLVGVNVLGRLLMELREEIRNSHDTGKLLCVEPLPIPDFLLNGQSIGPVTDSEALSRDLPWDSRPPAASMLRDRGAQEYLFGSAALDAQRNDKSGIGEAPASIHNLKPYPACKDSGVPWLGEVPSHWKLRRTKALLRERSEKGFPDEPLLAATQTKGVVRKEHYESRTVTALKDLHLLKLVRVGDFVISLRSFQGGIEYAREQGIISPAYTILFPVKQEAHRFLAWLFKSKPYIEGLSLFVTGIRQGQNIDYEKLSRSELPCPPLPEQTAIVRFLDYADRRIRRYIRAKKKLIALLNEQRQAIIHRAVTRGLNPDVRLKASGVEWLGDVPEHWTISRLKFEASHIVDCLHATPQYVSGGEYPAIRTADIEPGKLRLGSARRVDREQYDLWTSRLAPQEGDILYSREGERFGIAAPVPADVNLCISQRMMVFRIRPAQEGRFIMWQLNAPHVYAQAAADVIGATSPHVNVERIRNFWIALPALQEQELIAGGLEAESLAIDVAVERLERELVLIREFRTRLIADVVTGKLDVREAAAGLPDDREEMESLDRGEALAEYGDEVDGADDGLSEEAVA